ncbi:hypothetical protein [Nocardioides mangrovi]|uniref:Uncharacterized protein n=1 Tax=Nocardioides mangrovi TaxID=2874580 RepID=A0ABS7UDS8_9ACTN|nr:hypothetical protein [Nocardioides mangrovi]MBZ5739020.1 hypothetical protein [Nocardioides mangrovi]
MYGDTDVMRKRARELREQGVDLRATADRLVAQTEHAGWTGRAAAALDERVRDRATHLREVAAQHDTAADTLDAHLAEVDRLKDLIAAIERRADGLVTEARTRVARLRAAESGEHGLRVLPDPEDEQLAAFEEPPPGHRAWLAVELPGL